MKPYFSGLTTNQRTQIAKFNKQIKAGKENYKKVIQQREILVHYTYTSPSGKAFSTIKHSVEECKLSRDKWFIKNH